MMNPVIDGEGGSKAGRLIVGIVSGLFLMAGALLVVVYLALDLPGQDARAGSSAGREGFDTIQPSTDRGP